MKTFTSVLRWILKTVLDIEDISNIVSSKLIEEYHKYLVSRDTNTNYQKDNIKLIQMFANFLGESMSLVDIKNSNNIVQREVK